MAAACWGRAWRSKILSTAQGANTEDGGRWLQQRTGGGSTSSAPASGTATTYGTTTTTGTTTSCPAPLRERSPFDFLQQTAPVVEENAEEERVKKLEHLKALVVRFPCDGDSAPERWLSELEVTWVLHLAHVSESKRSFISGQLLYLARSWILALSEITKFISVYFGGWCINKDKEDGPPSASEFIRFVEATLSKMLPFIDAIVAARTCLNDKRCRAAEPADEKLQALILLRDALSTASVQILSSLSCVDFTGETRDLLSAELLMAKLDEAIWDTMEETRTGLIMSSWWWGTPTRSSGIHSNTRSFISYVKVLWDNYGTVNRVLHDAFLRGHFVPGNENASHLTNLTIEMFYSLEEKLTRELQSFPDQSLKFLFLINNFHFILQQLWPLGFPMPELAGKIHEYVSSYIQVSWAPALKCLHNPTPRCFTRRSPLPKFSSQNFRRPTTLKSSARFQTLK